MFDFAYRIDIKRDSSIKKSSSSRLTDRAHNYFNLIIRLLLNVLLVIIMVVLVIAIYKSAQDAIRAIHEPLETILQNLLLDVVLIVAVVEMATIVMGYLKDGHVHVRYIIDTVLVIIANEFVVVWFNKPTPEKVISLCLTIITLAFVRILITRFLPDD